MAAQQGREQIWHEIKGPWDLVIVGGGITGAGLLREAARMGIRALLVEAHDYSSGTSSRSSKMVHGGLRYLSNAQFKLTMESVHERERLLKEGRGLIEPLPFLLTGYGGDKTPSWVFGVGLMIYDVLAMKWNHKHFKPAELAEIVPQIRRTNLVGGYRFYDAQTDDARLVLRVIQEAVRDGGCAINYARVESLMCTGNGRVQGVIVRDMLDGGIAEIQARVVINATGAWADELRACVGERPRLRRLRGSHLIFSRQRLPVNEVVSFLHPADHRPVFAFPWEGVTLVGTTDVDHRASARTDPWISPEETEYLLQAAQHVFPALGLKIEDVQSTFAGLRGVLDTGKANPSKESRDQVLWDEDGLITITGGKLTMFRQMAQCTLEFARKHLAGFPRPDPQARMLDPLDDLSVMGSLDPVLALRLLGRYGHAALDLVKIAPPEELEPVEATQTIWAELRLAARQEQVVHLDDLMLRRTRLGLLLPGGGLNQIEKIRLLAQPELGWDDTRWQIEVDAYRKLWLQAYSPQPIVEPEPATE